MHCPLLNVFGMLLPSWMRCAIPGVIAAVVALERTAAVADDATARSYANGLSTLADAASAQKAHALASAAKERAYADARIAATALTFASDQLREVAAIPDPLS